MPSFDIKLQGLNELTRAFEEAPKMVLEELGEGIKEIEVKVKTTMIKEAPHAFGNLQKEIKSKATASEVVIWPDASYSIFVHEGTRPHWPPYKDPNSALALWCKKKGIENPYLVARAISRRGTTANPFVARTVEATGPDVQNIFSKILYRIISRLAV